MSRLVARIMLALLMLPLGGVVYIVIITATFDFFFSYSVAVAPFLIAGAVSWIFIGIYWTLLWRGTVRWTSRRVNLTAASVLAVMVPAAAVGAMLGQLEEELGAFVGGVTAVLLWLTLTIFIWRETPAERAGRVSAAACALVCPTCGYNLTGLKQTTCPECGASWTMDELLALQPGKDAEF